MINTYTNQEDATAAIYAMAALARLTANKHIDSATAEGKKAQAIYLAACALSDACELDISDDDYTAISYDALENGVTFSDDLVVMVKNATPSIECEGCCKLFTPNEMPDHLIPTLGKSLCCVDCTEKESPLPEGLECWKAGNLADCLDYDKFLPESYGKLYENLLCVKLWNIQANAEKAQTATPMGGDGTDGTYEDPSEIESGTYDDEARHWWSQLLPLEQRALVLAYDAHKKEYE